MKDDEKEVRFLFENQDPHAASFVYRPPKYDGPHVMDATLGVKFSQNVRILDDLWLFGGTRLSRTIFRLRHPLVYSKRGLRNLYRRIKRIFVKNPPMVLCRHWITKEEALKHYPNNELEKQRIEGQKRFRERNDGK